ncbi:MAG: ABC transporter permease [Halobacteriota archaeon]|nr:ABC transporter permease [Halobacteriota archaeon]
MQGLKTIFKSEYGNNYAVQILSIFVFILLWHMFVVAAREGILSIPIFRLSDIPTPYETGFAFINSIFTEQHGPVISHGLIDHTFASLTRVIEGFFIAFIVGVPIGLVIGYSKIAENVLSPIIEIVRQIPPMAWIPIALFVFISGRVIFIVFIGVVFPLILNTSHGVKSVDPKLIESAQTMGASGTQILTKVIIPAALPSIFTGSRIGLGVGWMCIVAAEMLADIPVGLGYHVWNMAGIGRYAEMVATMCVIGFIGYIMNGIILITDGRLLKWL